MTRAIMVLAEREGDVVHVRDVDRGLACGCTCPTCGDPLVARHGELKVWHFAHHAASVCVGTLDGQDGALLVKSLVERILARVRRIQPGPDGEVECPLEPDELLSIHIHCHRCPFHVDAPPFDGILCVASEKDA
jgi:hypothetical protein